MTLLLKAAKKDKRQVNKKLQFREGIQGLYKKQKRGSQGIS